MKKRMRLSLIAAVGILFAQNAFAEGGTVGFVDVTRLLKESMGVQGMIMQHDKIAKKYEADIEKEQRALIRKEREIQESEPTASRAEMGKKIDEFEKEKKEFQEKVQLIATQIKENTDSALREFQEKAVNPVVREIAKERGFDAVANLNTAVYVSPAVDLTDEVIERVNKKMPKLDFPKVKTTSKK